MFIPPNCLAALLGLTLLAGRLAAQSAPLAGELPLGMTASGRQLIWPERLPNLAEVVTAARDPQVQPLAMIRLLRDGNNHYAPTWSADGKHLALLRSDIQKRRGKLLHFDLGRGDDPRPIYGNFNSFEHMPRWSSSGPSLLFFSSNNEDSGNENLHIFDPLTGARGATTGPGTKVLPSVAISAGRPRVIYRREDELIEVELSPDGLKVVNSASLGIGEEASFSPDGASVAFVRPDDRGPGNFSVLLREGQTLKEAPLVRDADRLYRNLTWSPDGKQLAYFSRPRTQREWELWTLVIATRGPPRRIALPVRVQEDFRHVGPAWSPDGRRLWYFEESGQQGYRPLKWISPDGATTGWIDYPKHLTSAMDVAACPQLHVPAVAFVAVENLSFDPYIVLLNHP
jgi:Tol biopolymer transport system component